MTQCSYEKALLLEKCPHFLLAGCLQENVVIFRFSMFAVSKCFCFIDILCGECVSAPIYLSALFGYPLFSIWPVLNFNWPFSLTPELTEQLVTEAERTGSALTVCSLKEKRPTSTHTDS